jgi:hypothetical protein
VRGTGRTSSSVDGVADRGANAGRDGRACGKREEGRSTASQTGGGGPVVGCHAALGRRPDRVPADCDPGAALAGDVSLFRTGARRGS